VVLVATKAASLSQNRLPGELTGSGRKNALRRLASRPEPVVHRRFAPGEVGPRLRSTAQHRVASRTRRGARCRRV